MAELLYESELDSDCCCAAVLSAGARDAAQLAGADAQNAKQYDHAAYVSAVLLLLTTCIVGAAVSPV
jgi:hypothetical protein